MKRFKRVLVANRGEIAVRVIRACKELGIGTVAVYSDADSDAMHRHMADKAVHIGRSAPQESYLNIKRILDAAKKSGCDALHPGYGFLSESFHLAAECKKKGIAFIGPNEKVMYKLGQKIEAKRIAEKLGVPTVPGTVESVKNKKEARQVAEKIGYPVLIKASAGGGGRGMRIVNDGAQLEDSLQVAENEAKASFDDGSVFIEKYLDNPRHIEVQILGDGKGGALHFFERECSIQRRYQKLLEEAPASVLKQKERERIWSYAISIAKELKYMGACTCEFIMDSNRNIYFIEMNARIQVEHGISELICGMDIVKEQISVASGNSFSIRQEDIQERGHAIECRICAENPKTFVPSFGLITKFRPPLGKDLRVDTGISEGSTISQDYDSLIAKLMSWGRDREEAIARMRLFLEMFKIEGIETNISLFQNIISNDSYLQNRISTDFLKKEPVLESLKSKTESTAELLDFVLAAVAYDSMVDTAEEQPVSNWVAVARVH